MKPARNRETWPWVGLALVVIATVALVAMATWPMVDR